MNKYDICVIGMGYIGVPTATIFASKGKRVLGVDVSLERVNNINNGKSHVGEADIDELLRKMVKEGNLTACFHPKPSNVYIIAVPTPFWSDDDNRKHADLTYVEKAVRSIALHIGNSEMIILESTSPVGTTRKVKCWLEDEVKKIGKDKEIDLSTIEYVHCPERILPGQMLKELVTNDRICGGITIKAAQKAKELYSIFCKGEIFTTDDKTAELSKLTENAYRDVSIAFANELSLVCDKLDVNVWELIKLANRHPRVNILQPGPGVGGHCIAVDPWFIIEAAENETPLMKTARRVNDNKPIFIVDKVLDACKKIENPIIACFGLTFKANVNDLRESPALNIVKHLIDSNIGEILVVEPHINIIPKELGYRTKLSTINDAIKAANILLILVEHKEFSTLKTYDLRNKTLIDTKGYLIQ